MVDDTTETVPANKATVALKGFRVVMSQWGCSEAEQKQLLGLNLDAFGRLMAGDHTRMPEEVLRRIRYVMGIARALDNLYPTDDRAAQRIRRPTTDEPFLGLFPLEFMLAEPDEGLKRTRRYFDWKAQTE